MSPNRHPARRTIAATSAADCYQCGKCSAGCPMADTWICCRTNWCGWCKWTAHRPLPEAIWKCVSCMTCSARCPKSVDCAGVMDALRQLVVGAGLASAARRRTMLFQQTFLENIRRNGRLREVELIGVFKTKAFLHDRSCPCC